MTEAQMRVPDAGQDLIERRIVREGKRLAAAMLAEYADPPRISIGSVAAAVMARWQQLRGHLQDLHTRP